MKRTDAEVAALVEVIFDYYQSHSRSLPWRLPEADGTYDGYKIMVSELMLQQTQVARVIPKYQNFLEIFPTVQTLANALLGEVLIVWSGLGYNRRAKFLHAAAQKIVQEYDGQLPRSQKALISLPGIGENTAAAILVYTYNQPAVFIETNIRTVYLHHFFSDAEKIKDQEILTLLDVTLPVALKKFDGSYREFYWALMDYGSYLKKTVGGLLHLSHAYTKQSTFQGSQRQIRGAVLRELANGEVELSMLARGIPDKRLPEVLRGLEAEGLVQKQGMIYSLPL